MSAVIIRGGNIVSKKSSHNRKLVQIIFNDSSLVSRLICDFKQGEREEERRKERGNAFVLDPDPRSPCPSRLPSLQLLPRTVTKGMPQVVKPLQTPEKAFSGCDFHKLLLLLAVCETHAHTRRIRRISNKQAIFNNSRSERLAMPFLL